MPLYEYLCPKCDLKFELKQSFSDASVAACPKCRNGARRLFTPVPIIFKGPGFFTTDNRKGGTEDAGKKEKEQKNEKAELDSVEE